MRGIIRLAMATLIGSLPLAASAGELVRGTWQSTECAKPIPPPVDRTDAQSLNLSMRLYNDYVSELHRYFACLKTEAETDQQIIVEGFNAAQDEAEREALAARPRGTEVK